MLKDIAEVLKKEKKVLFILSESQEAQQQIERFSIEIASWNLTIYERAVRQGSIPKKDYWMYSGSMEDFIAFFEGGEAEKNSILINQMLSGVVAEYSHCGWEVYQCRMEVMSCCVGKYLKMVNRKEWRASF